MSSGFKSTTFNMHREELVNASEETKFIVFLCGPTIKKVLEDPGDPAHHPAAVLRANIKQELEGNGFEVVLGEDDGLEDARLAVGRDAQDNELEYISKYCDAVIVVTASSAIGAFCELGLFSWHFVHPKGVIKNATKNNGPDKDFILLVDKKFKEQESYFNKGPASIISAFGLTAFVDFSDYDISPITERLKLRKAMIDKDGRGRPRGGS